MNTSIRNNVVAAVCAVLISTSLFASATVPARAANVAPTPVVMPLA
ncbi:MAG: hypothetical protein RLZZ366_1645 [Pseudomonadota bacterium]